MAEVEPIRLEPVDALAVTTLVDNVTDILLADEGPARRPPIGSGPRVPASVLIDRETFDALRAEHGFAALVTVTRAGRQHRVLFDTGISPDGLIENKKAWTLDELYALPQETQITRLICVEGWSAIGKWTGAPLRDFLRRIGADLTAKYVHFACAEGYSVSIDMPTALHPQTQMTFKFDGEVLPTKFGFPLRIRMPTKLGFKNPKHVVGLAVLNNYTGGYWEDRGYNWFSGL